MIFEKYITTAKEAFINRLFLIAGYLKINPVWLIAIMYHESRLNPKAVNSNGGASGLIGFMPATAVALGTTIEAVRNMDILQQLELVYKYFKPYAGRYKTAYDLFLYCFLPAGIGKDDSWIFHTDKLSAATIRNANKIFDLNLDGVITLGEYKQYLKLWFDKYGIDAITNPAAPLPVAEIFANPVKAFKGLDEKKKES